MQALHVKTKHRTQLLDITNEVRRIVQNSGARSGICFLYVPHTTAGILINEHADPEVASDAEGAMDGLVPDDPRFKHAEGNTDSHVKTMLVGMSQFVFIENGNLALGRWQGIFLAEFDGPRERSLFVKIQEDAKTDGRRA